MESAGARIGLVLGAGGVAGVAFEIAALATISERTGWLPTTATVTVGTSAGAWVSALLRATADGAEVALEDVDPDVAFAPNRDYMRDTMRWMGLAADVPFGPRRAYYRFLAIPTPYTTSTLTDTAARVLGPYSAGWPRRET